MAPLTPVRETDCSGALRERAIEVANHHLEAGLETPVLLVGLRSDGREFLLFLDHCFPDDPLSRRQFIAFILGREDVIAYAYASRYADIAEGTSVRLHVVAWSRQRVTLTYCGLLDAGTGARTWCPTETHDFRGVNVRHPDVPQPDAHQIDDVARLAEYEAAWTSLLSDGTRCFWRWNVGRQQPGFPFPTAFAGRSIVDFVDHERSRPGLGFQAHYTIVDDEVVDLYAYGGKCAPVQRADQGEDDLLAGELARACAAMLLVKSRTLRRQAELVATGTMAAALPGGRPIRYARFRLESAGSTKVSFVVLARYRDLFLKLRLTTLEAADVDRRAERAAAWLASYLGWLDASSTARAQLAAGGGRSTALRRHPRPAENSWVP